MRGIGIEVSDKQDQARGKVLVEKELQLSDSLDRNPRVPLAISGVAEAGADILFG